MQSDLQNSAVQISYEGAIETLKILKYLIEKALENRGKIEYGEQSLKKLNMQGKQLESVNLSGEDIKDFKKQLKKYNVDFSVMKDKATGEHTVFFKGQDIDRVYKGLENAIKGIELDKNVKKPINEVIANAVNKSKEQEHTKGKGEKTKKQSKGQQDI